MIEIKQLRLAGPQPRVAQPHSLDCFRDGHRFLASIPWVANFWRCRLCTSTCSRRDGNDACVDARELSLSYYLPRLLCSDHIYT
jgi:hypothetical protein